MGASKDRMAQEPFPSLMNKYELAKKINELEGLTNEEKSELLKLLRSQKKYGLVWEDKPENAELKMVDEMPVLEEVPERAIVSDDPAAPNHVLIEGDNLEALTALSYTHTGKIDVIYIPKGEDVPGLTHNNLRYYKTKFVPRDKTTKNLRDLMTLSTDMLCIRNDAYTEKPFAGKNIDKNIARYFESSNGKKRMLVIFREEAIAAIVELIKQVCEDDAKYLVYVFSPNCYAYDDEFEDVADQVELCALPDAILNAYRRVLPKRKPQLLSDALSEFAQEEENGNMLAEGVMQRSTSEAALFAEEAIALAAEKDSHVRETKIENTTDIMEWDSFYPKMY